MLLDPETLALAAGVERLLPAGGAEDGALLLPRRDEHAGLRDGLRGARGARAAPAARRRARGARGPRPRRGGLPSVLRPEEQPIVDEPRYLEMVEELGAGREGASSSAASTSTSGWRASTRASGRSTGSGPGSPACSRSRRTRRTSPARRRARSRSRLATLRRLPRGGPPPPLATPADWEAAIAAAGVDYTRIWWDARPHPRFGTLEVRIADQRDVASTRARCRRSRCRAVQALCAAPAGTGRANLVDASSRRRASSARGSSSRRCASRSRPCASSRSAVPTGSRRSPPIS